MDQFWDVVVVGGGAAGLWAAGTAAGRGRKTLVLEKNRKAGVKILISGGTRCNITQACSAAAIADAFGQQGDFLRSPLSKLSPQDVVQAIEAWGVPTKVEETGKIFPCSDRALDVRDALVRRMERAGAELRLGAAVRGVARGAAGGFQLHLPDTTIICHSLILATGGLSYPASGTTGDGYAWVRAFQHTIVEPRPALTPLRSGVPWIPDLSGLTLPDVLMRVPIAGTSRPRKADPRLVSREGLLWTHLGLSGPAPLNVSRALSEATPEAPIDVELDLLPDCSADTVAHWFGHASAGGSQRVGSLLRTRLPRRLADQIVRLAGVSVDQPLAELSRNSRESLVRHIKSLRIPISGTLGYDKAEVTAGGVDLREVDSRTMQSRLVEGLFLCGEILDLDGPIGGYNFQAAFSTGHAAGLVA